MIPVLEWAPLQVIPVIPLGRSSSSLAQVRHVYPGPLDGKVILTMRRLRAAVIVPREPRCRESSLPIPAIALNRWSVPRNGLFHAPTARGFDVYRVTAGVLREVRSESERPVGSVSIPAPPSDRKAAAPYLVRNRSLSLRPAGVMTVTILLMAAAAQYSLAHNPDSEASMASTVSPGTTVPVVPMSTAKRGKVVFENLPAFRDSLPFFNLESIAITIHSATVVFSTSLPPGQTVDILRNQLNILDYGSYAVSGEYDGFTRVTVEVRYDR